MSDASSAVARDAALSSSRMQRVRGNAACTRDTEVTELAYRVNVTSARSRRLIDIVAASLVLAGAIPILIVAAFAILAEDGRPVIFRQRRVGRFGRLFTIYKLRTMSKEACDDRFSPTSRSDARITRSGQWLRRTSIDELPQLFNILRGDMTFVGPRPEMPFVAREYEPWQHLRQLVQPGVTGLWQVSCRKTVPMHLPEATLLDLRYIRSASCLTDARVLAQTVRGVVSAEGAY
jgi:lipopolysaccharide/colanic/teichoic acid biosynthesis glycosyltransferase